MDDCGAARIDHSHAAAPLARLYGLAGMPCPFHPQSRSRTGNIAAMAKINGHEHFSLLLVQKPRNIGCQTAIKLLRQRRCLSEGDRKSVVWGTRVSVRVTLGGRSLIKKKKQSDHAQHKK